MIPVYLNRPDWGADPVVRSSSGAPRPALAKPARWITVHYTGNATPLVTADRAAVVAAQQSLERWAAGQDKPNEYNFCLYSDAVGQGYVVEYAGAFQAAHSAGENAQAFGVLFYVGVDQAAPDAMVDAYRWLRDRYLYPTGLAVPGSTSQTPHRDMPDAATPCPGPVLDRWADLLVPYSDPDPGPDPAPIGDPTMFELWRTDDSTKIIAVLAGRGYNFADNNALARFREASPRFPERVVSPGTIDAFGYGGTIT